MPLHEISVGGEQRADGWIPDQGTWTRTANTTFTTTGDTTATFSKGTRIRVTDTTTKYFVVAASSHSAGTTTITITGGSDYSLAANPTAQWYSYDANPQGYPTWFNYSPTRVGWSGSPTVDARFSVIGTQCTICIFVSGTSDSATTTVTVPITAATVNFPGLIHWHSNSGTSVAGRTYLSDTSTVKCGISATSDTWTASGTKFINVQMTYII